MIRKLEVVFFPYEHPRRVPDSLISMFINTVGLYGQQKKGQNIAFSALGLLWQVSDFLVKSRTAPRISDSQKETRVISSEVVDHLQMALFLELKVAISSVVFSFFQALCTDSRAEVRSSAMQTLHNIIVAYGPLMTPDTWESCRSSVIFDLLSRICDSTISELDSSVASASELGTDKNTGEKLMMLMHHSRNTGEKQWSETRVHVLQGTTRVLKQFFVQFSESPNFESHWKIFLG